MGIGNVTPNSAIEAARKEWLATLVTPKPPGKRSIAPLRKREKIARNNGRRHKTRRFSKALRIGWISASTAGFLKGRIYCVRDGRSFGIYVSKPNPHDRYDLLMAGLAGHYPSGTLPFLNLHHPLFHWVLHTVMVERAYSMNVSRLRSGGALRGGRE
jgi:hypothetical protein